MSTRDHSRTQRVTLTVTPDEKRAIQGVARLRNTDESSLMRESSVSEVVQQFDAAVGAIQPDPEEKTAPTEHTSQ